eukprot:CAMPEP_0177784836 /NCGR_PEP_ID=MMETSP0491_2-20121128/19947_1 /TAXON_ID=63592 /ORGANISM="Tetraselmis chuii, Strain PLY429" /LENGTH=59 /DNA_ID=CAMNT_0019305697 /DNA_START=152 /DNA_END=331 /DNA_ORIENTATION=-
MSHDIGWRGNKRGLKMGNCAECRIQRSLESLRNVGIGASGVVCRRQAAWCEVAQDEVGE